MTAMPTDSALTPPDDLAELGEWLDGLIQDFAEHPDEGVRGRAFALLDGVDALHRAALGRLAALLQAPGAEGIWAQARNDRVIRTVLLIYDVLPQSERERAAGALAAVFPYIESHGGTLELLGVADGVVTVRLGGSCQGCAGSTVTLGRVVEGALRDGYAGFRELRVEDPLPPPRPPLPIPTPVGPGAGQSRPRRALPVLAAGGVPAPSRAPRWHDAATLDDLPLGAMRGVRVADEPVLLLNAGGDVYAYRDACPDTPLVLSSGRLDGDAIVCPWHGCRFDPRTGERLGHRGTGLASFPVAIAGNVVRVAVNAPGPAIKDRPQIAVSNRS